MRRWLEDYLLTDLKEKMKHKATEGGEKRTVRHLRESLKLSSTRLSLTILRRKSWRWMTHFFSKVLQRIDRMNEKMSKTSENIRCMPTSSCSIY